MTKEEVVALADASCFHTAVQEERHNYYGFIANIIRESA